MYMTFTDVFEFSSLYLSLPMALVQVDVDLQTLFQPLMSTQRGLTRAIELRCQIDELSDFTEDVDYLQQLLISTFLETELTKFAPFFAYDSQFKWCSWLVTFASTFVDNFDSHWSIWSFDIFLGHFPVTALSVLPAQSQECAA